MVEESNCCIWHWKAKVKHSESEASKALPTPQPVDLANRFLVKVYGSNRTPMARRGFGTKGRRISLLTNHFYCEIEHQR
ncbi:hypothetical protein Hanom_Chr06g00511941 [Helianthus anomalus]